MSGPGFITGVPWFKGGLPVFGDGFGCIDFCTPGILWSDWDRNVGRDSEGNCVYAFSANAVPSVGATNIVEYKWEWWDGTVDYGQTVTKTIEEQEDGEVVPHSVRLTITDDRDCKAILEDDLYCGGCECLPNCVTLLDSFIELQDLLAYLQTLIIGR